MRSSLELVVLLLIGLFRMVIGPLLILWGGPSRNTKALSLRLTARSQTDSDVFNWGANLQGHFDKTRPNKLYYAWLEQMRTNYVI